MELYNINAERFILGCLLINVKNLSKILFLQKEHFVDNLHQDIFEKIQDFSDKGVPVNAYSLQTHFQNRVGIDEYGGVDYLVKLHDFARGNFATKEVMAYGGIILEMWKKRSIYNLCAEMQENITTNSISSLKHIEEISDKLNYINRGGEDNDGLKFFNDVAQTAINEFEQVLQEKQVSIKSGFAELDDIIGGFAGGGLTILGGRPSMGKTAFIVNLACNMARTLQEQGNKKLAFFSYEMRDLEIYHRSVACNANTNYHSLIKNSDIGGIRSNMDYIIKSYRDVGSLPIMLADNGKITISGIRRILREKAKKGEIGAVIIDYLQLINNDNRFRSKSTYENISQISKELKILAGDLNVPVIALSQLSRSVESRADKRPQMSDLRDSGSIEQDADNVMFIYREAYYTERAGGMEQEIDKTDIIVAKQRSGRTGTAELYFNKTIGKFAEKVQDLQKKDYRYSQYIIDEAGDL